MCICIDPPNRASSPTAPTCRAMIKLDRPIAETNGLLSADEIREVQAMSWDQLMQVGRPRG